MGAGSVSHWALCSLAIVMAAMFSGNIQQSGEQLVEQRERMVREQLEGRGVRNRDVLDVMRRTPRHLFGPTAEQAFAYQDTPVNLGSGATVSQPYIVGFMTELLAPEKGSRVLEIGTGSGYQAAVLAQLAARVYTIEIMPDFARAASVRLAKLGYTNVVVRAGDGFRGWPEEAPFDRILLTAAPKEIPPALIDQLAIGGRLVGPVGPRDNQELVVMEKETDGSVSCKFAGAVLFVPMVRGK